MKRLPTSVAILSATLVPTSTRAADLTSNVRDPSKLSVYGVIHVLINFINFGLAFVAAIAAIFIVVNGYQYIFAAGNPEKIEKAKQGVTWSIGGFILAISSIAIVNLAQIAFGADTTVRSQLPSGIGANGSAADIIESLARLVFFFGGAVAVLFIILGGYRYVTSQGDQELAEQAKKTLLYAVIGLIIVFASFLIFDVVADALKVQKVNR